MAPKPKPARLVFAVGMVLAMALTILAVMTTAIGLRRVRRYRFTTLNFRFCTKAVDHCRRPWTPASGLPPPALPPVRSLFPLCVAEWPAWRLYLSFVALAPLGQNEEPRGPGRRMCTPVNAG